MPRRARRLVIGLVPMLLLAGCGYRSLLEPYAVSDEGEAVRLAIVSLRNDAPEPWLDRIVSDALRREVGLRGRFKLVPDPARADLVLRGRILPLVQRSNSFSSFVAALEYKVTLTLELEVLRAAGDVVRLHPRSLSETEIYLASPDIEVTRSNRLEALRHLSDVIATRVADSLEWISRPASADAPSGAEVS